MQGQCLAASPTGMFHWVKVSLNQGTRKLNNAPRLNQISSDQGGLGDCFTQIWKCRPTYWLSTGLYYLCFCFSHIHNIAYEGTDYLLINDYSLLPNHSMAVCILILAVSGKSFGACLIFLQFPLQNGSN